MDYDDTQTRVTFPAGVTSVNQTVPITTDTIFEGTEDFTLVLDIPRDARRFRVTAGDQRRAIGEIVDDCKLANHLTTCTQNLFSSRVAKCSRKCLLYWLLI